MCLAWMLAELCACTGSPHPMTIHALGMPTEGMFADPLGIPSKRKPSDVLTTLGAGRNRKNNGYEKTDKHMPQTSMNKHASGGRAHTHRHRETRIEHRCGHTRTHKCAHQYADTKMRAEPCVASMCIYIYVMNMYM